MPLKEGQRAAYIYISAETAARLDALEARWGLSRSATIARALELAAEIKQD